MPSHPTSWTRCSKPPPPPPGNNLPSGQPQDSVLCQRSAQGCQAALPKRSLMTTALGSGHSHSSPLLLQGEAYASFI